MSTGNNISDTIAIGNNALENIGLITSVLIGSITAATNTNPVEITVDDHGLPSGTRVTIENVLGMTELNAENFYVLAYNSSTLKLYSDLLLSTGVDGTGYGTFTGVGTLLRIVSTDNNIAIGNGTAPNLIDGANNFFIGNRSGRDITTGSNNFFIGSDIGNNFYRGSGNISIGSENIINGVDNQIGFGSVFYYDGLGLTNINSNTRLGVGEDSTSTNTGALTILGGAGITGSVYSREGQPDENYLLYTPRVFVSTSAPVDPRIADVWVDTTNNAYLQYIKDGDYSFWLQIGLI